MQWQDIENVMHTLEKPSGGFTLAHRGIVTMPDGTKLFVKIGVDDESKRWARKEIVVYKFLQKHSYPYIPKFIACNPDQTGFALEALVPEAGWDWTESWNEARLQATFKAMDALAAIKPAETEKELFGEKGLTGDTDGWQVLKTSPWKQQKLHEMLRRSGHQILADTINTEVMAQQSATYVFKDDSIVHHDVRADNCAWCAQQQIVKLTDWSWTQLGDRTIDINAMLVHVHKAGLNVLEHHANRLHPRALQWLAGFWFNAATEPPRSKAIRHMETRQYQLESGVTALELADKLAKLKASL